MGVVYICDEQVGGYRWHVEVDGAPLPALRCICDRPHPRVQEAFIEAWSWHGALLQTPRGTSFEETRAKAQALMAECAAIEAVGMGPSSPDIEEEAARLARMLVLDEGAPFASWRGRMPG